jgi:ketosteroid isomerase-like protein
MARTSRTALVADAASASRRVVMSTVAVCLLFGLVPYAKAQPPMDRAALEVQLKATETAFAKTMADRDLKAFAALLADETVFFGSRGQLRGKDAVAAAWARFFEGPDAPFSWTPEEVAVLDSGTLGLTSGPVFDPEGNRIGTFNSVWRRDGDGWRIVFDKGCPPCTP